jgi:Fic-DOC domain mobile mystery protein B
VASPHGSTPIDPDEAEGLIPGHIGTQAELNEWEQANIAAAETWLASRRRVPVLSLDFLRELHARMFGSTWTWAGSFRTTGKSIGVPAHNIPAALDDLLANTLYQVEHKTFDADEIALRFHHELVRIHPFPNGNGRHARFMTDLLLIELGRDRFTWGSASLRPAGVTRSSYLTALKAADNGDLDLLRRFTRS